MARWKIRWPWGVGAFLIVVGALCAIGWYFFVRVKTLDERFEDLSKAITEGTADAETFAQRGRILFSTGKLELALQDIDRALAMDPNNSGFHYYRSGCLKKMGRKLEAIGELSQAIQLENLDPSGKRSANAFVRSLYHDNRGVLYRDTGMFDQAIQDFDRALELVPASMETRLARTHLLLMKLDFDGARDDLDIIIKVDPSNAQAYRLRSEALLKKKDLDNAWRDADYAQRLEPKCAHCYFVRAMVLKQRGKPEEAHKELTRSLDIDSRYVPSLLERGRIAIGLDWTGQAVFDLSLAIEVEPKLWEAYFWRGLAHYFESESPVDNQAYRLSVAVEDLSAALEIKPSHLDALWYRGLAYNRQGRWDQAIKDFSKMLELNPDEARALAERGKTHCDSLKYAEAHRDLDRAIALQPNSADFFFLRGLCWSKMEKPENAIEDISRGLQIEPKNPGALHTRARLYCMKHDLEKALDDARRCSELGGKLNSELERALARACR